MGLNGIGFVLSLVTVGFIFYWTSGGHILTYWDAQSVFVVIVGTTVIGLIAVPKKEMRNFIPMFMVVARGHRNNWIDIVDLIVEMAEKSRQDLSVLKSYIDKIKDPFLNDAISLLVSGFSEKEIKHILQRRSAAQVDREQRQTKMFKSLGKYPPACGLLGTVLGMIVLLGSLGQEGAAELIGPAMSVALVATLYGVILANFIILPMSDNLSFLTLDSEAKRSMIIEGIQLIKKKESPIMIKELLLSHIPAKDRGKTKKK